MYVVLWQSKMADSNGLDQKPEDCRDYKRNVCTKGDNCKYYHPPKDVNSIFERNSVCHDFQNPKVTHDAVCLPAKSNFLIQIAECTVL